MTLHLREIDSEGFILDGHLSVSNTSELSAINISDNSFWMGDETLISLSGGKIKFKKRNKSVVPPAILQAGVEAGHESHQVTTDAALAHAGVANVHDMKLSDWYKYLRTLKGDDTPGLNDVFSSYTDNDFEETRIGIGVADPTEALDVLGNINFSGTLKQGGNPFVSTPWTIESNPAALSYTAGNVGVGAANPIAKLHISNAGALYTAFSDTNAGTDEKNWWTSVLGNQLTHYISNDENSASQPYMQVTREGYTVNSVIFNYGKVGIGGNAGNVPLKVHGDTLLCCGANDNVGLIANNPNRQWRVGIRGDTNDIFSIQDDTAGQMRLTIDSVGNVGIRTTNPGAPLEVHGADLAGQAVGTTSLISRYVAGEDGVLNIFGINQSEGEEGIGLQTQIDGRSWQSDLSAWSTGSEGRYNLCLQPYKGYVGVGTTTPETKLHVETPVGTAVNYVRIGSSMNDGSSQSISGVEFRTNPQFYNGDNVQRVPAQIRSGFYNGSAGTANWGDAYVSLLTPANPSDASLVDVLTCRSSKVGIRRTNPEYPLDVTGSIRCSEYLSSKSDEPSMKLQNQSFGAWLYVGGWSSDNNNDISRVRASNGNMHLDCAANGSLYLNWYSEGSVVLGRNTVVRGSITTEGSQSWDYDTTNKMYIDNVGTIRRNYSGLGSGFHFTSAAIWPTDCNGNYTNGGTALGSWEYQYSGVYTRFVNSLHQNQASYFGPSAVGFIVHDNHAAFGHRSRLGGGEYGMLVSSDGHTFVNMTPGKTLHFRCGNVDKIRMHDNGYLAFGNSDPKAPIDVSYSAAGNIATNSYYTGRYLTYDGIRTMATNEHAWGICANFDGGGVTAHAFYAGYSIQFQSDSRIKKEIHGIDDSEALEKLRRLKPSTYKYKEPALSRRTTDKVYGFIAQEVAEVLPYAVKIGQSETNHNHIPNIMSVCVVETTMITPEEYEQLNDKEQAEYHFLEDHAGDVCEEEENRYARQLFTIEETYDMNKTIDEENTGFGYEVSDETFNLNNLTRDAEGKYDELIFSAKDLVHVSTEIKDVIDSTKFTCKKFVNPKHFMENDRVLLYGQKVSDFHNLDKNAIFTVATAALQEVDRQLQQEKEKVRTLEITVQSVLERLTVLEQK